MKTFDFGLCLQVAYDIQSNWFQLQQLKINFVQQDYVCKLHMHYDSRSNWFQFQQLKINSVSETTSSYVHLGTSCCLCTRGTSTRGCRRHHFGVWTRSATCATSPGLRSRHAVPSIVIGLLGGAQRGGAHEVGQGD